VPSCLLKTLIETRPPLPPAKPSPPEALILPPPCLLPIDNQKREKLQDFTVYHFSTFQESSCSFIVISTKFLLEPSANYVDHLATALRESCTVAN
jgi:hypothetical protein